jgi:hypothetical protein
MNYIATFYTHLGAVRYHRFLQGKGIQAETMPVPRKYSSDCGIGVRFTTKDEIRDLISEDINKLYLVQPGEDRIIYKNELE